MALTTTTLAAACGVNDTTIRVTSATGFLPQQLLRIDDEMLAQSGAGSSGTTLSVRRGIEGTIPAAHASGATVASGGGADFASPPPGQVAVITPTSANVLRQQTKTIPHAEILTLPTSPVTVIAAPGPNRIVMPLTVLCDVNTRGGAYTVHADASWVLMFPTSDYPTGFAKVNVILQGANHRMIPLPIPWTEVPTTGTFNPMVVAQKHLFTEDLMDMPLLFGDDWESAVGNYTGGHASNSVTVYVTYVVYDMVLKALV